MSARSLPPAAAGGLTAALVSSLVRSASEPRWDPTFCPVVPPESDIHWPSIAIGILIGLLVSQLLDLIVLLRQWLSLQVRHRGWSLANGLAIKQRSA